MILISFFRCVSASISNLISIAGIRSKRLSSVIIVDAFISEPSLRRWSTNQRGAFELSKLYVRGILFLLKSMAPGAIVVPFCIIQLPSMAIVNMISFI